jgi:TRAP-type C4-dicarboxylate transport system substrate-binding protein
MNRMFAAAALAFAALIPYAAQAVELRFAFPAPPQSLVNQWGITPWAEEIKKDSNGALDIKIIPGPTLGTFGNIYDRTANGVADISFGVFSAISARFPKTEVANVPFVAETPMEAAIALQRLFDKGLIADEFKDVKVLCLFAFGTPAFHLKNKEVTRIEQVKGMKLAAGSRLENDILALFGAAPQSAEPTELYQGISRGLYEGSLIPWSAFLTFKLGEVTKYHLELPLGTAGAFVVMNKNSYDKLSADLKKVLDKHSGERFARHMGDAINRQDAFARDGARKMEGQVIHSITEEDRKTWAPRLQPLVDQWARNTPNGEAVLAAFRKEVAAVRAEK